MKQKEIYFLQRNLSSQNIFYSINKNRLVLEISDERCPEKQSEISLIQKIITKKKSIFLDFSQQQKLN